MAPSTDEATVAHYFGPLWIGPTSDPERFLEMERRIFKVEPRPIPGHGGSAPTRQPRNRFVKSFTRTAEKVARKLEALLRAPFEKLSSLTSSTRDSSSRARTPSKTPLATREAMATPETPSLGCTSQENERKIASPRPETHDATRTSWESLKPQTENISRGNNEGRVKSLIRLFEDMSDASDSPLRNLANGAVASSSSHASGSKNIMKKSFERGPSRNPLPNRKTCAQVAKKKDNSWLNEKLARKGVKTMTIL